MIMRRSAPLLLVIAAVLTACGSRAAITDATGAGEPSQPGPLFTRVGPATPDREQPGASGELPIAGGGPTPETSPDTTPSLFSPSIRRSLPVLTVGAIIPVGSEQAVPGAGEFAVDADKQHRMINALVAEVNSRGGFAGHRIKVVVAEQDYTDTSSTSQIPLQNEICTRLTEDEKVFVVLAFALTTYANECYARHRTPLLRTSGGMDEVMQRELEPWLLPPLWLNVSRMARLMPVSFAADKFLTQRMGLIAVDHPMLKRSAERYLIPGIAARGGKVIDTQWLPNTYEGVVSGISSAVLRFKGRVDRVVMWAPGGGVWQIFSANAESQGYRPRYGVSTFDVPGKTATLIAPAQLAGTVGAGFFMTQDVTESAQPQPTTAEKSCWQIVNKRASDAYSAHGVDANAALSVCDSFLLMRAAFNRAPATAKPADVISALTLLDRSYAPVQFAQARFVKGRPDGLEVYSRIGYVAACGCMRYTSAWQRIPD